MNKDVCVIVPYYNGSKFIERALKSIYSQTVTPSEVIVVDDGSSEDEAGFLIKIAEKYPFKLIKKDNGGQGSARNEGVFAAKSEYICFLDQDDYFYPWHIDKLLSVVPDNNNFFGFAYGDVAEAEGNGDIVRSSMIKEHSVHPKENLYQILGKDMFVLPSASIISRVAFESVGGFDEQFTGYEDDDLFLRMFRGGFTNIFVDESVTVWCIHSASTSYSVKMSRSRWRYYKKLKELYPDDRLKKRFIFSDLLRPRFGPLIFNDALQSKLCKSIDYPELKGYFVEFFFTLFKDKHVRKVVKLKYLLWLLLLGLPRWLLFILRIRCGF
ncbi:MAG: hypothetical protein B7Y07_10015 [Halothiobacillus sp. 24-54-40]|nr:MAG: hypothetical protein B7Y58_09085 [Halothiobacillus sp. 35-54-62]OYZ85858.1 MAG: hypothetical protein B7Y07_10015 [Halothiobacillus sp. 24-54-40]OZB48197.1 MAG: hypothetical protein B7X60_04475 [Polynucleobacter sp. 39-45-136]HQS29788.1 glycosyltransferase family A protein [Halothiobacillus sp.]